MKIQLDINKRLNKQLKIEKATLELNSLQELIIYIIEKHYKNNKEK